MKTMLRSVMLGFSLLFFVVGTVNAQRTINLIDDGAAIGAGIDEATKAQIIEVVQDILNRYYNIASFWDENNEAFDEDKYTAFISLFSGSARVYEDIADEPTNIEYSTYANNVYQYLQEEGVQFDLENAYLNSIDRDDSGFYFAELDIEKIVYVGLDKNNLPVKFGDGRRYALNVRVDMPDYDVTDAKIEAIKGEEAAKRVATPAYLSANFHYGLGQYLNGTPNSIGETFGDLTRTSASVLGGQLLFRKALSSKENLWFHLGVGAQQHTFVTGFDNFNNSDLPGTERSQSPFLGALVNGATPQPYVEENGETLLGNVTINSITDAVERLNILTIDVPIGVTMRLNRTFSSRVFLDLSIVPSYSITSSGQSSGTPKGFIIPDSEHFPSIEQIQAQSDGAERLADYTFSDADFAFTDNDLSVTNNFGLGVQLSPTYQYDISFNYGVEIGINLWYNVLSITTFNDSQEGYLKSEFGNGSFGTKTSILEDYYNGVNPFYASLKVGFFYKIQ